MRIAIGIVLICVGMLGAVSAASLALKPPPANPNAQENDPAYKIGQVIGGALCTLVPFVSGVVLLTTGKKRSVREEYDIDDDDRPRRRRRYEDEDDRPRRRRPDPRD